MDTFMDKLAQRFTAQEMIRANSAAEAEEMNKLKVQVESYTQCLNRMQQICAELEQTAEVAKGKVDAAQLHTDELKAQLLEIRRDMQSSGGGSNVDISDDLAEMIAQLRRSQESRFESIQDAQKAQLESMQDAQRTQLESMQGAQQAQLESMRSSLESQIFGLKTDQELQFNGVRGMQEDQLESIRGLQGNQLEGLRGLQETQLEAMRNSVEDQLDSVRSMIKAQISSIRSGQDGQLDSLRSALEAQNTTLETQLGEMKTNIETQLESVNDTVHKECVKVYRNVQAVVGEENNKQSENLDFTIKPMEKKIKKLFSVSVTALIFSIAGVVIQILQVLNLLKF